MEVNGPINIVRIEGSINNVKKVLYLLMDYHARITFQKECENITLDIDQLLDKTFKENKNITYDLFVETRREIIDSPKYPYKDIYIRQVGKMVKKKLTDKKYYSNKNSNVRYHYSDIRDFLDLKGMFRDHLNTIRNFSTTCNYYGIGIKGAFDNVLKSVNIIASLIYTTYSWFTGDIKYDNKGKEEVHKLLKSKKKMIDKMKNKWNDKTLKDKVTKIFSKLLEQYVVKVEVLEKMIKEEADKLTKMRDPSKLIFDKLVKDYVYGYTFIETRKLFTAIQELVYLFYDAQMVFNVLMMDYYFVRRFLDKDYVVNAIHYSGSYHSVNTLDILVNSFGFKITHASFSRSPINKVNKMIKESKLDMDLLNKVAFELLKDDVDQCSSLKDFPPNFT